MENEYNNIKTISQPKNMKVLLFQHQLASIYNMEKLEEEQVIIKDDFTRETNIGILADKTGYGKSLSLIGLICRDKMKWNIETPFVVKNIRSEAGGKIRNYYIKRYDKINSTLILASINIIGQWECELNKTTLKYITINSKNIDDIIPDKYDVVLVSNSLYNRLLHNTTKNTIAWKRFIFDEPGHLKVPSMTEIIAGFYWFVTATPRDIISKHYNCRGSFMKEIADLNFDSFKDIIIENDPEFVELSFAMPETYHHRYKCYQPISNIVRGIVTDSINNMISAGNIEDAIMALGGGKTGNVIELVKEKKLKELKDIENIIEKLTEEEDIKKYNYKKDEICSQIIEVEKRFQTLLEDDCVICQSKFSSPVLEPNCQNLFCGKCIIMWLEKNRSCPLCRKEINGTELIYIKTGIIEEEEPKKKINEPKKMTKSERIVDILKNNPTGKFLIFSDYDYTFNIIHNILKENSISYSQLKGNITQIQHIINEYKIGYLQVIFLNSNYSGSGINLQETTDIILYHELCSSSVTQVIGRANRIGRKIPLHVHHLEV